MNFRSIFRRACVEAGVSDCPGAEIVYYRHDKHIRVSDMAKATIRTGQKFSRLLIVDEFKDGKIRRVKVLCDCGNTKVLAKSKVVSGETRSCGCLASESARDSINKIRETRVLSEEARSRMGGETRFNKKHGMKGSPEYSVWNSMISRCENPSSSSYENYGARGISVCPEWRESFEAFFKDMGERPSKEHSIDRVDNDGDYTPRNCRWASRRQQHLNKRNTVWVEYRGGKIQATELARELGIKPDTFLARLRRGFSIDEAVKARARRSR